MVKKRKISKKNKHYFQKFFDGELSLPHSYWLVGIVYSFGVGIILAIFMIGFNLPERAANVLALPWFIFVAIGIWKSATNYKRLRSGVLVPTLIVNVKTDRKTPDR